MLHIHTSPGQLTDIQNQQMRVYEKMAESKNFEALGRVLNYVAVSVSAVVLLVFTRQLAANYSAGVVKVAGDLLRTDTAPKALIGSAMSGICGAYFTEQSKNLRDEARCLLDILEKRPVVILKEV